MTKPKILFFIKDSVPTEAERLEASEIVGNVVFRNASIKSEFPETCDAVAGAVPDIYKTTPVVEVDVTADAKPAKRGPKPRKFEEPVEVPELSQTPLIPADTGWKANS